MSFENLLNAACDILSPAGTQAASGEVTSAWSVKHAAAPTRVRPLKSYTAEQDGSVTVQLYRFYFAPDLSIAQTDRISYEGETYEIVSVSQDSSGHHTEVQAKTVTI